MKNPFKGWLSKRKKRTKILVVSVACIAAVLILILLAGFIFNITLPITGFSIFNPNKNLKTNPANDALPLDNPITNPPPEGNLVDTPKSPKNNFSQQSIPDNTTRKTGSGGGRGRGGGGGVNPAPGEEDAPLDINFSLDLSGSGNFNFSKKILRSRGDKYDL
jgi:predicted PurR-regulated permease PerM